MIDLEKVLAVANYYEKRKQTMIELGALKDPAYLATLADGEAVKAFEALRPLVERVQELERQNSFFLKALKENFMCPYSRCKYDYGSELDEWECANEDHQDCWIQAAKEAGE